MSELCVKNVFITLKDDKVRLAVVNNNHTRIKLLTDGSIHSITKDMSVKSGGTIGYTAKDGWDKLDVLPLVVDVNEKCKYSHSVQKAIDNCKVSSGEDNLIREYIPQPRSDYYIQEYEDKIYYHPNFVCFVENDMNYLLPKMPKLNKEIFEARLYSFVGCGDPCCGIGAPQKQYGCYADLPTTIEEIKELEGELNEIKVSKYVREPIIKGQPEPAPAKEKGFFDF